MPVSSVVITANPVKEWEQFSLTLDRQMISRPQMDYRDLGGDWSASFSVHPDLLTRAFSSDFLANGMMRHVEIYNEKGVKDWTGFITKMTLNTGTAVIEADIADMANRVWVRYNPSGTVLRSTTLDFAGSQDRYGIKQRVLVGGKISLGVADAFAQQVLDWVKWPSPGMRSLSLGRGRTSRKSLDIRCSGYWHTLGWRTYTQTASTGEADASVVVQAIIDDVGEYIRSSTVDTNTTQVPREYDTDRMAKSILQNIAQVGDGAYHKWVIGVSGNRDFYYKQAQRPER